MKRTIISAITISALFCAGTPGSACGPWFPKQYLGGVASSLLAMPEFFAEIELKLLAREFQTPFKAVRDDLPQRRNAERDIEDFDAAIKDGSIRPPDPDGARFAHKRMRTTLTQLSGLKPAEGKSLPDDIIDGLRAAVFPSEFADFHEGAFAYGRMDHAKARAVWERLLARPENERRYRTVNAAFMIGVLASVDNQDDAPKWLEAAREFARKGFRDSSGLAAASYAWEAAWLVKRGELRKAAEAELRAVASGYPTRSCVEPKDDTPEELAKFAADPLLRRIHTGLLLAAYTGGWEGEGERNKRFDPWLAAVEAASVSDFAGAERVAWMYYSKGNYVAAGHWLNHASKKSPDALWLEGKLAAREGRRDDSLRALSKATRLLAERAEPAMEVTPATPDTDTPASMLAADHGVSALDAAEFQTALDAFLRGGYWVDAAYVAERLLTVEELKKAVSKRRWDVKWDALSVAQLEVVAKPVEQSSVLSEKESMWDLFQTREVSENVRTWQLRWLLARRLARLGRFAEARPFFPAEQRGWLDLYTGAIARGKDTRLARNVRGMALWEAALQARYNGIELFGTDAAPDWFAYGGDFERTDPATFRATLPDAFRASAAERRRLKNHAIAPEKRFHYRYNAADLAWQAARLMPDNDRRLAEMLDLAGRWLAPRDPEAADRFYQAIEKRCAETEIGRRAVARHWFVDIEEYSIPSTPGQLATNAPAQQR